MGSNNGTGQPNWFRCSKCRTTLRSRDGGWRATLTGRKRPHRGKVGARITFVDREYTCDTCGHVGWSAHIDLCRQAGDNRYLQIKNGVESLPNYARADD